MDLPFQNSMILAANIAITLVIGPHKRRSARDGVIQLSTHMIELIVTVSHPVHLGQWGQSSLIERIDRIIARSKMIETAAIIRPCTGNAPSCVPPCVIRPHRAPKINAI